MTPTQCAQQVPEAHGGDQRVREGETAALRPGEQGHAGREGVQGEGKYPHGGGFWVTCVCQVFRYFKHYYRARTALEESRILEVEGGRGEIESTVEAMA